MVLRREGWTDTGRSGGESEAKVVYAGLVVNRTPLAAGDGLGVEKERELAISGDREDSFLLRSA